MYKKNLIKDLIKILIPEIKGFQKEQLLFTLNKITIPGMQGYLLLLKQKK